MFQYLISIFTSFVIFDALSQQILTVFRKNYKTENLGYQGNIMQFITFVKGQKETQYLTFPMREDINLPNMRKYALGYYLGR